MSDIVERLRDTAHGVRLSREAADEIERLRQLVGCAYGEGIVDVFHRGARISEDNDTWETSDAKVAMDDIEYHRLTWPERFGEAARKDGEQTDD